jgi:transcription initiation factor IIF auxiliary subunit
MKCSSHARNEKKNLISFLQLTVDENYAVFDPNDINVNQNLKPTRETIIDGGRLEFVYVMSTQTTYVDKTRKNKTMDL